MQSHQPIILRPCVISRQHTSHQNQRTEDHPRLFDAPQHHLYNGLARPVDYSIFARTTDSPACLGESVFAQEQIQPRGNVLASVGWASRCWDNVKTQCSVAGCAAHITMSVKNNNNNNNSKKKIIIIIIIIIITSASVKLKQTRHSHSKQLFHGAQISQGFYREGQKVETCNRKFPFESNLESSRRIVVQSFNVTFLLIAIWDKSQMFRFVENIARSLLGYQQQCACSNYKYMN